MEPIEDRTGLRPRRIVSGRTIAALGDRVYLQLGSTLLGSGFSFRQQLVDFFPDPYQDDTDWLKELHDETSD